MTARALMNDLEARPTFTSELDPGALIDGDLFAAFAAGELPVARLLRVARVAEDNAMELPGGRVVRTVTWEETRWTLVEGPDWRVRLRADDDGEMWAWVFGTSSAVVEELAALIAGWNQPSPPRAGSVDVTFAYQTPHGPMRRRRSIEAPVWAEVATNYGTRVRRTVDALVSMDPARIDGRLVLLWGPPGTGKTTLLRTVASQWAGWCDAVYVTDPERLFNDPAYLTSLVLAAGDDDGERWTLLVVEDCDELLRPDAKHVSGQALSRLLNLTDGMVGQGLRVLVCLTTNEDLWRLHPAVTRPGRCLAQIEVGRLTAGEAADWLKGRGDAATVDHTVGPDGVSLAELFALSNGEHLGASSRRPALIGQYL